MTQSSPPTLSRRDFRHTKIICTLGPVSSSEEVLRQMAAAGMNIARFNMSHGNHQSHGEMMKVIKKLNQELNHPIAFLLDTQGPEIRTGEPSEPLELERGEEVTLTVNQAEAGESRPIFVSYPDLVTDLKVGDRVTLDSGIITLQVLSISGSKMRCLVVDGGKVGSRRHVNLPGV